MSLHGLIFKFIFIGLLSKGLPSKNPKEITGNRIQTGEYSFDHPALRQNDFPEKLSRMRRQQSGGGCVIPRSMPNGTYRLDGPLVPKEGELAPYYSIIQLICPPGYITSSSVVNFCDGMKNDWFLELATCKKMCKRPKTLTVEFNCTTPSINGQASSRHCDTFLPSGTTAYPRCRNGHHSITNSSEINCIDGRWEHSMPTCTAECGKIKAADSLNLKGTTVVKGGVPWYAAIYLLEIGYDEDDKTSFLCGGSIISSSLIISAAHCFYNDILLTKADTGLFTIAVGKRYRDFSHPEEVMDHFIQKSRIKRIEIPEEYDGEPSDYSHDVALVILETPIEFSDVVMPICLNLVDEDFDVEQTSTGSNAMITGFGFVGVNETVSDVLNTAVLSFVSRRKCRADSPGTFLKFITWDKVCAGNTNGIRACTGDNGGGLVASIREKDLPKWFLRGILSISPHSEIIVDECFGTGYSTFTRPFFHRDFIEGVIHKQGCTMPDNPPNGKFRLIALKNIGAGEGVAYKTPLLLECDEGYVPSEEKNNICDEFIDDWINDLATCLSV